MGLAALALVIQFGAVAADLPAPEPHFLYHATARDPYFHGKYGFRTVVEAKNHCYKEFKTLVARKELDPRSREFFSYIYTIKHPENHRITYFHSSWQPASFLGSQPGAEAYGALSPIAESDTIRKNTLIHSHPTTNPNGAWPSRLDVALASNYRKTNGKFRYLYLVNSRMELIQFKAVRFRDPADPSAVNALPMKPVRGVHWMD